MNTETPTPETDKIARVLDAGLKFEAICCIAKLERERDEAREKLAAKSEFCDSLFLTETWDKLFAERDQLRKVADELAATLDKFPVKWDDETKALASYNNLPHKKGQP